MLKVALKHVFPSLSIDIQFEVEKNCITALFGKSGSGKTSILNIISGLVKPDYGYIEIDNNITLDTKNNIFIPPHKRNIGYIFQDSRLFPHLNVLSNLKYGMNSINTKHPIIQLDKVINTLELENLLKRKPSKLSGGEKQRVAIARSLLTCPRVLLMDEPLASIDSQMRAEILPFIEGLQNEFKITVLYVSHSIEEVIRLADKMILISEGEKEAQGSVEQIMSRLDLYPLTGRFDAGAVISAKVEGFDKQFELLSLSFEGGTLLVNASNLPIGKHVRTHIRARDVSLSLKSPSKNSILNIFKGNIIEINSNSGPQLEIKVDIGVPIIARITRKSFEEMHLSIGTTVYAMIKAVAINRRNIGV